MGAKAVIIDHEPLMAAQLKKLLQRGDPSIEVKSICYEGEQAMACLAAHQPDIVFLTLEMPRVSGMTIARQIEAAKGLIQPSSSSRASAILFPKRCGSMSSIIWSNRLQRRKCGGSSRNSALSI
ncbi:response regulator receiver domain protein [Megasphaera sp. BL7]|uniref:LytR/AlgR family response regulator transcription factor n=1 Tax=Megasphaera sp. BL7 TaxID=1285585 RepID=UPI0003582582|nr:response regulator [Megasphaera sp. BL7]EPP15780.1 response regulator receiver domain protein [Megasphaera sp. BL7]